MSASVLVLCSLFASLLWHSATARSPIIIFPGIMGSQMEAKLSKASSNHSYCSLNKDWYRIWFTYRDVLSPWEENCFAENIMLYYKSSDGSFVNAPGVETRIPGFGNTSSIENLDPAAHLLTKTAYFDQLVNHFVDQGYTRGKDIRAAPFDWRMGPRQLFSNGFFEQLQKLVEQTYEVNNGKPVTLLSHSMGSLVAYHFLIQAVSQDWKNKYIDQFVSMAGPWLGASRVLRALVSGDTDGMFILSSGLRVRPDERSFPSDYWLLPLPSAVWNDSLALVTTPSKVFTASNITDLLDDLKIPHGNEIYTGVVKELSHNLSAPNVSVVCLYGSGLPTEQSFSYSSSGKHSYPDGKPVIATGDGDGTVNIDSLLACQQWSHQQKQPVLLKAFANTEHFTFPRSTPVLDYLSKVIETN